MAKRKRLAPAQTPSQSAVQPRDLDAAPLEVKSLTRLSAHPVPPIASVAGDASSSAALAELSETLRRARAEGRMIMDIALGQIDEAHLVRDRIAVDDDDMAALRASLAARGQQTPIELVALDGGRYGLISGWRRVQALRALGHGTVRAIITAPREAPDAYVAMIEENEIRVGLSYFERARITLKAVENGVFDSDKTALQTLFSSASRAKRSKIKSFMPVVEALGGALKFPAQLGERLGLQISKALSEQSGAARRMLSALSAASCGSAEEEQEVLKQSLKPPSESVPKASGTVSDPISGVRMKIAASGQAVTLQGRGVDADLCRDLALWLKARG